MYSFFVCTYDSLPVYIFHLFFGILAYGMFQPYATSWSIRALMICTPQLCLSICPAVYPAVLSFTPPETSVTPCCPPPLLCSSPFPPSLVTVLSCSLEESQASNVPNVWILYCSFHMVAWWEKLDPLLRHCEGYID